MNYKQAEKILGPQATWPNDFLWPNWGIEDRVHNWRNYVSEPLKYEWLKFSEQHRLMMASCFQQIANREEWD